jgi:hypothetical protein
VKHRSASRALDQGGFEIRVAERTTNGTALARHLEHVILTPSGSSSGAHVPTGATSSPARMSSP